MFWLLRCTPRCLAGERWGGPAECGILAAFHCALVPVSHPTIAPSAPGPDLKQQYQECNRYKTCEKEIGDDFNFRGGSRLWAPLLYTQQETDHFEDLGTI